MKFYAPRLNVRGKILIPFLALSAILVFIVHHNLLKIANEQSEEGRLLTAKMVINQIRQLRGYYAKNVVGPALKSEMKINQNHKESDSTLPLPATMVHELNEQMSAEEGYSVRLYSDYPFPWREKKGGGPQDQFEKDALALLTAEPEKTHSVIENVNGVPSLRFAAADTMVAESCVKCHNSHPETPRNNWKLGDTRGVLAVTLPIADAQEAAFYSAWRTTGLLGGGLLLAIFISAYIITRFVVKPLRQMSSVGSELASGNTEVEIEYKSTDETGKLANSFRDIIGTLDDLNEETNTLVCAAEEGDINKRGDESRFDGCYQQMVQGINNTLDAVCNPLNEAFTVMEKISEGDLTPRIEGEYSGEFDRFKNTVNHAFGNLDTAIKEVSGNSKQVSAATSEVEESFLSVEKKTDSSASALEEIASSVEEMSSMTAQTADNANVAKNIAEKNRVSAQTSNQSMAQLSEAIEQIRHSSEEQSAIVKTIDEIAFQTNLLALNAAVEAARAGDAGKGFAVVAEEVRSLAQRSSDAAQSTSAMIEEATEKTQQGVKITREVESVLGEIIEGAQKTSEIIEEIFAATNEQATGITQIETAVREVDKLTQETYNDCQESTKAIRKLNGNVSKSDELVGNFCYSDQGDASVAESEQSTPDDAEIQDHEQALVEEVILNELESVLD